MNLQTQPKPMQQATCSVEDRLAQLERRVAALCPDPEPPANTVRLLRQKMRFQVITGGKQKMAA